MADTSDYRIADGHDVALGSMTSLDPQPTSNGVQPSRRTYGVDGSVYDEGLFVELEYSMVEDRAAYTAILTEYGLFGEPKPMTNEVTVYARNEFFIYTRYNGVAVMPEMGRDVKWSSYFPRDIVILIKDLEVAS